MSSKSDDANAEAPSSSSSPFELTAGPYPSSALAVLSFRGREAISRPFSFEIVVAASAAVDDGAIEADLLGAPACLLMRAGTSAPRFVRGVVAAVTAQSAAPGQRAVYRLRIVPNLWLLKKRTTSRIFQDLTVPAIVAAVLDESGVKYALRLLGTYRRRTYCVQYRETDFAFVERLLAEEGIFYTFDHGGAEAATEITALSDTARLYPTIAGEPKLAYRPHAGAAGMAIGEHHVQRFELRRSLRSTSALRRGYDFRRPSFDLLAEAKIAASTAGEPKRGEVYEHHEEDEEPNIRPDTVAAELEQHRADMVVGEGTSGCRRVVPGTRFVLGDHDIGRLDREYVVTEVKHQGCAPGLVKAGVAVYENTFKCAPSTVVARPRRPARSVQQVTETAVVVGPQGQEIHTDEHGRVKVQFHWDREGKHNENSSCWIRVAQTWAGSGWGFQFIPRVGMEVVVSFLGGDTDRPLVTGCLYNGLNNVPFPLPGNKTRSGLVTRSTPDGRAGNELWFEDAKGKEQIFLHGERDFLENVVRDHEGSVGRDQRERVTRHSVEEVGGNRTVDVGGTLREGVRGNRVSRCDGDSFETISGRLSQTIGGSAGIVIEGDRTVHVTGNSDSIVGQPGKEHFNNLFVHGDHILGASDAIKLRADKSIVLQCGESVLEIGPDGIRLRGKIIDLTGSESASMTEAGPALRLGKEGELVAETLRLFSSEASLILDKEAKLKGKQVKLNCDDEQPSGKDADKLVIEKKPFKLKLSDAEYGVYAGKTYHLLVDGATFEGTTDGDGVVDKQIPKDTKSVTVLLWVGDYPTGAQKTWTIRMDPLPPPTTARGAQQRLGNMGYYRGEPTGEMDDATREALRDFQAHVGLPGTGMLDGATADKITTLHGK